MTRRQARTSMEAKIGMSRLMIRRGERRSGRRVEGIINQLEKLSICPRTKKEGTEVVDTLIRRSTARQSRSTTSIDMGSLAKWRRTLRVKLNLRRVRVNLRRVKVTGTAEVEPKTRRKGTITNTGKEKEEEKGCGNDSRRGRSLDVSNSSDSCLRSQADGSTR